MKKVLGCACEHLAVAWLQEKGYYVFKGAQTHCPVDLVAMDPKTFKIELFDVKLVARRSDGSNINRIPRLKNKGIQILSVDLKNKKCRIVPKKEKVIWS